MRPKSEDSLREQNEDDNKVTKQTSRLRRGVLVNLKAATQRRPKRKAKYYSCKRTPSRGPIKELFAVCLRHRLQVLDA